MKIILALVAGAAFGWGIGYAVDNGMGKWVAAAAEVGFRDDVMPGIMKDNAAKLLGLV